MSCLIFATKDEAKERSRQAWESVLGRKKLPEDVTEFLWSCQEGADGQTALIIDEKAEQLTSQESSKVITFLPDSVGENWERAVLPVAEEEAKEGGEANPGSPGELAGPEPSHEELAKVALAALPNPFMTFA